MNIKQTLLSVLIGSSVSLFSVAAFAVDSSTPLSGYNPKTGYSCNNKAGFKYGMTPKTMSAVVGSKKYYKGHTYIEYYDSSNGETGVRLSGHGINGGLCFNDVLDANLYLSGGVPCSQVSGVFYGSVGTNHPSISLRYDENTNKYGIRLAGDGVDGSICFHKVSDGLQFAGFMKEKKLGTKSLYEEGDDYPGHANAKLELTHGLDGNNQKTQTVHFMDTSNGASLQSITWLQN